MIYKGNKALILGGFTYVQHCLTDVSCYFLDKQKEGCKITYNLESKSSKILSAFFEVSNEFVWT